MSVPVRVNVLEIADVETPTWRVVSAKDTPGLVTRIPIIIFLARVKAAHQAFEGASKKRS